VADVQLVHNRTKPDVPIAILGQNVTNLNVCAFLLMATSQRELPGSACKTLLHDKGRSCGPSAPVKRPPYKTLYNSPTRPGVACARPAPKVRPQAAFKPTALSAHH
jgi:hypothetical protein